MWMFSLKRLGPRNRWLGAIVAWGTIAGLALACGIDTPISVLANRPALFANPIAYNFEVGLKAIELGPLETLPLFVSEDKDSFSGLSYRQYDILRGPSDTDAFFAKVEGLSQSQLEILADSKENLEFPFEAGAGLPLALRHYVAWKIFDHQDQKQEEAAEHLRAILRLSGEEIRPYVIPEWLASEDLSPNQVEILAAIRKDEDIAFPFEASAGLPLALRHYIAGEALRFHDEEKAIEHFHEILRLPGAENRLYVAPTWLMLGDIAEANLHAEDAPQDPSMALAALTQARVQVLRGAPDPYKSVKKNLGWEAKDHLDRGRALRQKFIAGTVSEEAFISPMAAAAELYLRLEDYPSVRILVQKLGHNPKVLDAAARHPLLRQVLIVNVLSEGSKGWKDWQDPGEESEEGQPFYSLIAALIGEAVRDQTKPIPNLDQLAALAYRSGDYDLARRLVAKSEGSLAHWVAGRLALQTGDTTLAAEHYAKVFAAKEELIGPSLLTQGHLVGEWAAVALEDRNYTVALNVLMSTGYWNDAVSIAEGLLSTEALEAFVAGRPRVAVRAQRLLYWEDVDPWGWRKTHQNKPRFGDTLEEVRDILTRRSVADRLALGPRTVRGIDVEAYRTFSNAGEDPLPHAVEALQKEFDREDSSVPSEWFDVEVELRDLLARRLVRDQRFAQSLDYFRDPETRQNVIDYAAILDKAKQRGLPPITQAETWYRAAVLARSRGMEMMGTEGAPDYHFWNGSFDCCIGELRHEVWGEGWLFKESRPRINQRYHYRYIAVEHAERAADLLPPRSQAFAAVLCHATRWMFQSRQEEKAQALYRRYVREGAIVPFATTFGRTCPEPDFAAVAARRK